MKEFDMPVNAAKASHAFIADGNAVLFLAMSAVCSTNEGSVTRPCGHCKNCSKAAGQIHPDIRSVTRIKDKKEISIHQIRELKMDVHILPNDADKKVYIINPADAMNEYAQNALLQMLEEPPGHVVFILQTSNPAALLPTVRSRCINIHNSSDRSADTAHSDPDELSPDELKEITTLARDWVAAIAMDDNLLLTEVMFRLDKLNKNTFLHFIPLARKELVSTLRKKPDNIKALPADDLLVKAIDMLEMNINTGHVAGFLCASMLDV